MIGQMDRKERLYLAAGGGLLCLLLLAIGLVAAYRSSTARLERTILLRQGQLQEAKELRDTYTALLGQTALLKRELTESAGRSPLTFLEETAIRTVGRERLVLMRPLPSSEQGGMRIETTEFKLERIVLEEAMRVLWDIENARPAMRVDKLYLKQRFDNETLLDLNTTVSTARSR